MLNNNIKLFDELNNKNFYIDFNLREMLKTMYGKIDDIIDKHNDNFIKQELIDTKELLDNINGYSLDYNQRLAVITDEINNLVVAGAGTGKSLTIVGKIRYLIERKNILPSNIICISFTNDSTNSLKNSILKNYGYNIEVLTFHKLAIKILKDNNNNGKIAKDDYLNYILDEYLNSYITTHPFIMKYILDYLSVKYNNKNLETNYLKYIKLNTIEFRTFKQLIIKFINLYKNNYFNKDKFIDFFNINKSSYKGKTLNNNECFLKIAYNVYLLYEEELNSLGEMDFSDLINKASIIIKDSNINYNYKYIIIDEYQDTSNTRYLLIKNLIAKTKAKLMCVGDDFQSIYRFTGCDLNIFLKFEEYFGYTKTLKIEQTYRNPQELIEVAGDFVMKNNNQIKKELKSNKHIKKPINIIYYNNNKTKDFKILIDYIYNTTKNNIMILGRNNFDINDCLGYDFKLQNNGIIEYNKNDKLNIRYLTVHKAKGLEEENVVLLNLEGGKLGFPNNILNNPILNFVINEFDAYPFEEERRLFYVALTRSQNEVYIFVNKNNPSIFVKELIKNYKHRINLYPISHLSLKNRISLYK